MDQQDKPAFFALLNTMGEFFSDELSELRQRVYFELFQRVSIEAWEYACTQCMRYETFHKVPLPAAITPYLREYETKQRAQASARAYDRQQLEYQQLQLERERRLLAAEAERLRDRETSGEDWDSDDAN